jgi:3-hydroxyisobutyrate dehydrogenase
MPSDLPSIFHSSFSFEHSGQWVAANGLVEGMRPDTAFFDMSTNSVGVVRKINAAFAEKNLYMLDSPVSGGPGDAASGKMAIWVGGD